MKGLVVKEKKHRVANYHRETVKSFVELMAAAGLRDSDEITRSHVYQRIDQHVSKSFYELYPYIPEASLLNSDDYPKAWRKYMALADADSFRPKFDVVFIEED